MDVYGQSKIENADVVLFQPKLWPEIRWCTISYNSFKRHSLLSSLEIQNVKIEKIIKSNERKIYFTYQENNQILMIYASIKDDI